VRARARGAEAVGLLWEVCRVPDFRKLLLETHVALLAEVYGMLTGPAGVLDAEWMGATLTEIDDTAGDIDTLTGRLAAIRTWTYISHQARWLKGAASFQARTRAIEDRLSDALHERLVQRFVERAGGPRAPATRPRSRAAPAVPEKEAPRGHPFAELASLRATLAPRPAALARDDAAWIEDAIAAPHSSFTLDAGGRIAWSDRPLGQLARGTALLLPEARLVGLDDLGPGARSRVLRRLLAFARDLVEELLAPLHAPELGALEAAGRGLVYQLEQGLGTALAERAREQLAGLSAFDRELLAAQGVTFGARVIHLPALLKPRAVERRAALCAAWFEPRARPLRPRADTVSLRVGSGADPRAYAAIGFPIFGSRAIRADVVERVVRLLAEGEGEAGEGRLSGVLGCSSREVAGIVEALAGERRGLQAAADTRPSGG
jgi:ATP-dependent RNA helicase SUPV3L1/SUV3